MKQINTQMNIDENNKINYNDIYFTYPYILVTPVLGEITVLGENTVILHPVDIRTSCWAHGWFYTQWVEMMPVFSR